MASEPLTVAEAITLAIGTKTRSDLARTLGIQASSLTRWANGEYRATFEDIAKLEDACGLRRGWILQAAGYVDCPGATSTSDAIEADPRLDDLGRRIVLAAYEAARSK